jgi:drug/metabolite transporter (DMT)-like permease
MLTFACAQVLTLSHNVLSSSTRKFFTILLSVLLYGHSLQALQWTGVALVFFGLGFDIYAKYAESGQKKQHGGAAKHAAGEPEAIALKKQH